jgi:hypothetical protein
VIVPPLLSFPNNKSVAHPALTRVFGYVAAKADVCVLLRHGSRKQVLMIRWDLATDEFDIGQWLNAPIQSAALSPDGRLFAFEAYSFRPREAGNSGPYLAISRPPYFTALAFWWSAPTFGGLRWSMHQELYGCLRDGTPPDKGVLPSDFRLRCAPRPSETDTSVQDAQFERLHKAWESLRYKSKPEDLPYDWFDADHRGRLLFAREGRIYVRDTDGERELMDLSPYEFRPLEAPDWAKYWPE